MVLLVVVDCLLVSVGFGYGCLIVFGFGLWVCVGFVCLAIGFL